MNKYKFYKEDNGRWYIDLPIWEGDKADLEMVFGADNMLEMMSDGQSCVWLNISEEYFEDCDKLQFIRLATEVDNGAFYKLEKLRGIPLELEMWLCDVTKFIFGNFPNEIYISVSN